MMIISQLKLRLLRYFRRKKFTGRSTEEIFRNIYSANTWKSSETVSGPGSELKHTVQLRKDISDLLVRRKIRSILDCGCGDFNWMKEVVPVNAEYTGIDIVPELIAGNTKLYASSSLRFITGNFTSADLVQADLLICRDVLVHLTTAEIFCALQNFYRSGSAVLLITSFEGIDNRDTYTGDWRPVNLQAAPFNLPAPAEVIYENAEGNKSGIRKQFCLWERSQWADIPCIT